MNVQKIRDAIRTMSPIESGPVRVDSRDTNAWQSVYVNGTLCGKAFHNRRLDAVIVGVCANCTKDNKKVLDQIAEA